MPDQPIQQNTERRLLPAWYYEAFGYKMAGLNYAQIAEKCGYSHVRVRTIFARGGALYDLYREWVETKKADAIEESVDMMFSHLPDTIRMMVLRAKNNPGLVGLEAGKVIMGYTLGKPEERMKLNATVAVVNLTDWALAQGEKIKGNVGRTDEAASEVAATS